MAVKAVSQGASRSWTNNCMQFEITLKVIWKSCLWVSYSQNSTLKIFITTSEVEKNGLEKLKGSMRPQFWKITYEKCLALGINWFSQNNIGLSFLAIFPPTVESFPGNIRLLSKYCKPKSFSFFFSFSVFINFLNYLHWEKLTSISETVPLCWIACFLLLSKNSENFVSNRRSRGPGNRELCCSCSYQFLSSLRSWSPTHKIRQVLLLFFAITDFGICILKSNANFLSIENKHCSFLFIYEKILRCFSTIL